MSDSQSESTADGSIGTKRGSVSSRAMSGRSLPTPSISESSLGNLQHYGTHIGYTTELEPILFDISQTAGIPVNRASYQKPDGRNAFLLDRTEDDKFENDLYSDSLLIIENLVGSHGPSLIQHFKAMTNRNFPIVEDAFFHIYESYQRSSLDPALLSAVYAIAASSPAYVNEAVGGVELDLVQVEDIAFRWFAHSISKPTLSTIQAGILLMQRPNIDSKTLNSQLVGIAYELGLHLDCSSWTLSDEERSLRKRLAWALYMQDKWCSLIHGRPSSISKNHWAVRELGEDDFAIDNRILDDRIPVEEVKRGRDLFCQMVALTEILSTILDTFYTLKAMQEVDDAGQNGTRLILEKAKPVQLRLKEWFMHLPRSLKMDSTMTGKPSATGKRIRCSHDSCTNRIRVSSLGILCNRNHSPPMYHTLVKLEQCRHIPLPRLPIRCQDPPHLCNGLCQPPPPRTPQLLLVLSLQGQLCIDCHVWESSAGYRPLSGRGGLLPYSPLRIQMDAVCKLQKRQIPRFCHRLARLVLESLEKFTAETINIPIQPAADACACKTRTRAVSTPRRSSTQRNPHVPRPIPSIPRPNAPPTQLRPHLRSRQTVLHRLGPRHPLHLQLRRLNHQRGLSRTLWKYKTYGSPGNAPLHRAVPVRIELVGHV